MTEFPNAVNLHSKLKPMLWHDRAWLDGVIYHASSVDDYTICDSRIYIRYDVDAPTDREGECYALIQFPGGGVISKKWNLLIMVFCGVNQDEKFSGMNFGG